MKAIVLATGKGTRLSPLMRRTVGIIRRLHAMSGVVENGRKKLYVTRGVRGGQSEVLVRLAEKKLEHSARMSRRRRGSLPRTHPLNTFPWPLFASFGLFCKRRCFQAELQKAQREVCRLCAA